LAVTPPPHQLSHSLKRLSLIFLPLLLYVFPLFFQSFHSYRDDPQLSLHGSLNFPRLIPAVLLSADSPLPLSHLTRQPPVRPRQRHPLSPTVHFPSTPPPAPPNVYASLSFPSDPLVIPTAPTTPGATLPGCINPSSIPPCYPFSLTPLRSPNPMSVPPFSSTI